MIQIVYNPPFGGYTCPVRLCDHYSCDHTRHDPIVVAAAEKAIKAGNKEYAIYNLDCGCDRYCIEEYDGAESVSCPCQDVNRYTIVTK